MNELFIHYNDVYKCIVDPDESAMDVHGRMWTQMSLAMDVHGRPAFKGVH